MELRTGNPTLNEKTFRGLGRSAADSMTINGTVMKTGVLLFLVLCGAAFTWQRFNAGMNPIGWIIGGAVGGMIVALVTCFKKSWAPITAPLYAVLEGLFLGGISAFYNAKFNGIVLSAVGLTLGTLLCLLLAYRLGIIKATENFKLGVFAATGGIALLYLVTIVLGIFGVSVPYIHDSGWIGIGFSAFVVVIAALNLVLDFDFIEQGASHGAPKYMEWYGAFGLMVTLIWLYIEILRLLSKLQSRR